MDVFVLLSPSPYYRSDRGASAGLEITSPAQLSPDLLDFDSDWDSCDDSLTQSSSSLSEQPLNGQSCHCLSGSPTAALGFFCPPSLPGPFRNCSHLLVPTRAASSRFESSQQSPIVHSLCAAFSSFPTRPRANPSKCRQGLSRRAGASPVYPGFLPPKGQRCSDPRGPSFPADGSSSLPGLKSAFPASTLPPLRRLLSVSRCRDRSSLTTQPPPRFQSRSCPHQPCLDHRICSRPFEIRGPQIHRSCS